MRGCPFSSVRVSHASVLPALLGSARGPRRLPRNRSRREAGKACVRRPSPKESGGARGEAGKKGGGRAARAAPPQAWNAALPPPRSGLTPGPRPARPDATPPGPAPRHRRWKSEKVDEAQALARSCEARRPAFQPCDGLSICATHSHGKCFKLYWCCHLGWCHCKSARVSFRPR
jgi:hypothetical protein